MNYFELQKIDLHCHLDGSVRPSTIINLAQIQNTEIPSQDEAVIGEMMIAPETCNDLQEYLTRFDLPLKVMQTVEALERITYELYQDAAEENVKYMEVRFAPLLHTNLGLSVTQIIEAVVKGLKRAEQDFDIHGNIIVCALRTMPTESIKPMLDECQPFLNKGVCAFDLAGAEFPGFCHDFIEHAEYARQLGFNITIHAGEQGEGQNVEDAIKLLHAQRVGHGIYIKNHAGGYKAVEDGNIGLETCPSSNVQTKAVANLSEHPAAEFYHKGLPVTINTDNRTVSNTTMTKEVQKVIENFNLNEEDYKAIYLQSVEQSFASLEVKQSLIANLG